MKRSNHWWLVRNRGEEGNVPQNVLEPVGSASPVQEQQVSSATPPQPPRPDVSPGFLLRHSGAAAGPSPWT